MIKVNLKGSEIKDHEQVHDYLQQQLNLPSYYGKNLDALWDLLSTGYEHMPNEISVSECDLIVKNLGVYGESLLATLEEIDNSELEIIVEPYK